MKIDLSGLKLKLRHLIPPDWTARIGHGGIGIGYDQATTEGELSNPASITVTEREGRMFLQRLVMRFKSEDYQVRLALQEIVLDDLSATQKRGRRLVIDATSEKAGAQQARDQFAGRVPVEYFVASANIEEGGLKFPAKTLLADRYRQAFEDNVMGMPPDAWILSDHSLVKVQAGRYTIEEDSAGNHGDAFVSGMLSVWGLLSRAERAELFTVDITGGAAGLRRPGLHPSFQRAGRASPLLA